MNKTTSLVPKFIVDLETYVPGKQPINNYKNKIIKLNTNENPYVPPVLSDWWGKFKFSNIRLYPDPQQSDLTRAASDFLNLSPKNIVFGNGSDELIATIFRTFLLFENNLKIKKVILSQYTYGAYKYYAKQCSVPIETIGMSDNFEIPVNEIDKLKGKVFFLANPNAPTGIAIDKSTIKQICQHNPNKLIVVDEAYIEFSESLQSCLTLIENIPNLIVLRTFSKSFSACGIRLGMACGVEELITALKKILDPYNVNLIAQKVGLLLIDNYQEVKKNISKIIKTKKIFIKSLLNLGFVVLPSQTNFVMVTMVNLFPAQKILLKKTKDLFLYLEKNKILVRFFDEPVLNEYLRISIGTNKEMNLLIEKIKYFLSDK